MTQKKGDFWIIYFIASILDTILGATVFGSIATGLIAGYLYDGGLSRGLMIGLLAGATGGLILSALIFLISMLLIQYLGSWALLGAWSSIIPAYLAVKSSLVMGVSGIAGSALREELDKRGIDLGKEVNKFVEKILKFLSIA